MTRKLYLASPLYGNTLHVGFHNSLLNLVLVAAQKGVTVGIKSHGCDSLVPRARNLLVQKFLDSKATDLLYVDADITFNPEDALGMLQMDEGIVGGIYPRKQLDWNRIWKAARAGVPPQELPLHGFVPVFNHMGEDFPLDRIFPVKHLGTGFMRVRREVYEDMAKKLGDSIAYDYSWEQTDLQGKVGRDFYPCGPDVRYPLGSGGRQYLSEDWAFCELARQCGYQIYADPRIKLVHSGYYDYVGDLSIMDASIEEELNAHATPSSQVSLAAVSGDDEDNGISWRE